MLQRLLLLFLIPVFELFFCVATISENFEYQVLHKSAVVCDLHCDTVLRLIQGVPLGVRGQGGHIDIPRMKEGGIDLQAFCCWVHPQHVPPESSALKIHRMIDVLSDQFEINSESIAVARTGTQAEAIIASGKIAAVLAIEGGHAIENSIEKLKTFRDRGVRYMTITWNKSLDWADAAADTAPQHGGLTDFGRKIIKTMNEIGVIIDVSHVAESTFWDIIETTEDPIIASHSCVYNLCPHFRNLTDNQIRAIARNGGVIGINFCSSFLDSTFGRKYDILETKYLTEIDSLWEVYKGNRDRYVEEKNTLLGNEFQSIRPPLDRAVDHIDYIVKLVGSEYVALGSDFDGTTSLPKGLEDCSKVPAITKKLLEREYSEEDIQRILGGNFLRVFKKVCG